MKKKVREEVTGIVRPVMMSNLQNGDIHHPKQNIQARTKFLSFVNCCTKSMLHSGLCVIPEEPVANDRTYVLSINDSRANTELSILLFKNPSN